MKGITTNFRNGLPPVLSCALTVVPIRRVLRDGPTDNLGPGTPMAPSLSKRGA